MSRDNHCDWSDLLSLYLGLDLDLGLYPGLGHASRCHHGNRVHDDHLCRENLGAPPCPVLYLRSRDQKKRKKESMTRGDWVLIVWFESIP